MPSDDESEYSLGDDDDAGSLDWAMSSDALGTFVDDVASALSRDNAIAAAFGTPSAQQQQMSPQRLHNAKRPVKTSPPKEIHGRCLTPNCPVALTYRGFCKAHGGTRRCNVAYCPKGRQGGAQFCIAHGGGKCCKTDGCVRTAQSRGLCKAHGGGARCKNDDCDKSAQRGGYCRSHGGVQLCSVAGCPNGVQRSGKCAKHDIVRLCSVRNCGQTDRGGGLCATHRRNKVCKVDGCNRLYVRSTLGLPVDMGFCAMHQRALDPSSLLETYDDDDDDQRDALL
ncbi:hypothetical protein SPRG_15034 [Saprolegnia parasitica CBS 223.65]|uniref:WRKY19-like zinc finger domain-containing protein n=1 Tax=Saprolegnia parasitica (strain CBS 223.65) TaxID=695850 RepID=A0A067BM41_SAPPC|nr:hypothetical protein SPRG_15034 [Saprolegnia parasitica CBS 223.65]KDO19253.1 hypothetical protein SPRG_15034 [Saprolegnia parasitica CBS 223.65]|eukprot:XP_012210027.1 hypothetical protein SPRG_15034 [Saprolegnia parasitica CBS 223.65]